MKRTMTLVVACMTSSIGFAAEQAAEKTCGQVLKEKSALPTKFHEFMTALSDMFDGHAQWMEATKTKEGKAEAKALHKIAKMHRDLGATAKKIATEMASHEDLAAVAHDPKTMDPKLGEIIAKSAALQKEMANMMLKDVAETEQMMAAMKAPAQKPATTTKASTTTK